MKNSMHMDKERHPFQFSTTAGKGTSKFARTVGVGPQPGGEGNKISANAEMRKKRPMQGPGDAK
jgi:hypothetical protein